MAICNNSECEKRSECYRYMKSRANDTEVMFKNICSGKNDYKWFWNAEGKEDLRNEELGENNEN